LARRRQAGASGCGGAASAAAAAEGTALASEIIHAFSNSKAKYKIWKANLSKQVN
jgi:hypothetical protein